MQILLYYRAHKVIHPRLAANRNDRPSEMGDDDKALIVLALFYWLTLLAIVLD